MLERCKKWICHQPDPDPQIKLSIPAAHYSKLLGHEYEFEPFLNWSWCVRLTHHPAYKICFIFVCVLVLIGQFTVIIDYYVGITVLLLIFLFIEMARFDRRIIHLTMREFEFYYLCFSIIELSFGAAILFVRQDLPILYTIFYIISLLAVFFFIFLLDAAPTYPRFVKVIAILCCLLGILRYVIGYTLFDEYSVQLDEPFCVVIKCFSPRSIMTSGGANITVFLTKILFQMRIKGMLVIPSTNLKLELDRKDEVALSAFPFRDPESPTTPQPLPTLAKLDGESRL